MTHKQNLEVVCEQVEKIMSQHVYALCANVCLSDTSCQKGKVQSSKEMRATQRSFQVIP